MSCAVGSEPMVYHPTTLRVGKTWLTDRQYTSHIFAARSVLAGHIKTHTALDEWQGTLRRS